MTTLLQILLLIISLVSVGVSSACLFWSYSLNRSTYRLTEEYYLKLLAVEKIAMRIIQPGGYNPFNFPPGDIHG